MSNKDLLDNIKKLRELTGVGFKDCKAALDESKGDINKSVEFLRKKGIAKASKKMSRTASEGLALVKEDSNKISLDSKKRLFKVLKGYLKEIEKHQASQILCIGTAVFRAAAAAVAFGSSTLAIFCSSL